MSDATRRHITRAVHQSLGIAETPQLERILGADLGQANDYTAITVATPDQRNPRHYNIGHIERVKLGTRYPAIVRHLGVLATKLSEPIALPVNTTTTRSAGLAGETVRPAVTIVLDKTGVGASVADMVYEAQQKGEIPSHVNIVPVTITGADRVSVTTQLNVPKRDLASVIQRLLQEGRIHIPEKAYMAAELLTELTGFRVKITASGHETYGAGEDWRSAQHDDMVLALALALWYGENKVEARIR